MKFQQVLEIRADKLWLFTFLRDRVPLRVWMLWILFIRSVLRPPPEWPASAWLTKLLREGDTVVEVGAGRGGSTRLISRLVGKRGQVLSFEPNPYSAYLIRSSVPENVRLFNVACGENRKPATLWFKGVVDTGGTIVQGVHSRYKKTVQVVRVDDLVRPERLKVGLLLIDAEGAELSVLRGAVNTLEMAKYCIVEVHHYYDPDMGNRVETLLNNLGFDQYDSFGGAMITQHLYVKTQGNEIQQTSMQGSNRVKSEKGRTK